MKYTDASSFPLKYISYQIKTKAIATSFFNKIRLINKLFGGF